MKLFTLALLCLALTGCYTSKFLPYAGGQQNWPTAPGSFISTNTAIPCYYGYPPRPYTMLGQIRVATRSPAVDTVQVAARLAKLQGADAVCVIDESTHYAGSIGTSVGSATATSSGANFLNTGASVASYATDSKVIAIKFQPAQ